MQATGATVSAMMDGEAAPSGSKSEIDLFIGIVTHPRSRYWSEVTSPTFSERMLRAAALSGLRARILVHDGNEFDARGGMISLEDMFASAWYQAGIEASWHRYVRQSGPAPRLMRRLAIFALRLRQYIPRVDTEGGGSRKGQVMLRRLANIELSHISLMRTGLEADATWMLILEDDAHARDLDEAICDISLVMRAGSTHRHPQFVSLSASFDDEALGIGPLLQPLELPHMSSTVLEAVRPVTNTVCAVLYRAEFVRELVDEYESVGLIPLCPIDWKLNAAILRMHEQGRLGTSDCRFLEPGPFVQRSMSS